MQTASHRMFLIMDSLRRYAGLTVADMQPLTGISDSNYSRILKAANTGEGGTLSGPVETSVRMTIRKLCYAYKEGLVEPGRKLSTREKGDLYRGVRNVRSSRQTAVHKMKFSELIKEARTL